MSQSGPSVIKNSVILGLALFSMLFGAGNVIFPPYIGIISGDQWFLGFVAYFFGDIALSIFCFVALLSSGFIDRYESLFLRLGPWPARILTGGVILSVCFIGVPRTATVSYELGVVPALGDVSLAAYVAIYFLITMAFCLRQNKIIDYIGKYFTPVLVAGLLVMIVIGFVSPLGEPGPAKIEGVWYMGLLSGYQTMDAASPVIFGYLISKDLAGKGFVTPASKVRAILSASVVLGILMFIVYGGLCHVGATASLDYGADVQHGQLIVDLFQRLLGSAAASMLGLVILLACLTTAIGLTGCAATFLVSLSNGRLKYRAVVPVLAFAFAMVANLGLAMILKFAVPIILIVFPAMITMAIICLFNKRIVNDNIFKIPVAFVLVYSILEVLKDFGGVQFVNFIEILPLQEHGFGWLLPAAAGVVVGFFVKPREENSITIEPESAR